MGKSNIPLLKLGSWVDINGFRGKVAAVMWTGGERYYFLIGRKGSVSMIPAGALEPPKLNK